MFVGSFEGIRRHGFGQFVNMYPWQKDVTGGFEVESFCVFVGLFVNGFV